MKFGIDISVFQKNIDLNKAKQEGVEFAILRAGFTGYGDGVSKKIDGAFESLYKKCKSLGIPVGAYWYSCATDYEKGKAEAKFMYENCLKNKQFEYPIYIDVEDTRHQKKAGKTAVTNAIKGFCEYLENKGFYVGIYANSYWFRNYIDVQALVQYDKWVANWSEKRPSDLLHGMWQFGGEINCIRTNRIAGLVCDQNYSYYDYPSIMQSKKLNGFQNKVVKTEIYTVRKGDTLSAIAKKYKTTYQKIAKDNNIKDPDKIYEGQKLVIK